MNIHSHPSKNMARRNPIAAFFLDRWRGTVPMQRLFWRDMVVVGTGINFATTIAALLALGFKAPTPVAMAIHFSALPYNIFLFVAVWRAASRLAPSNAWTAQICAALWLVAATLI